MNDERVVQWARTIRLAKNRREAYGTHAALLQRLPGSPGTDASPLEEEALEMEGRIDSLIEELADESDETIDMGALAEKVYRLFQQEIRLTRERLP